MMDIAAELAIQHWSEPALCHIINETYAIEHNSLHYVSYACLAL